MPVVRTESKWLNDNAKEIFKMIPIESEIDVPAAELLAYTLDLIHQFNKNLRFDHGLILKYYENLMENVIFLAMQFGMTPMSRKQLKGEKP